MSKPKMRYDFSISHRKETKTGQHFLTVSPIKPTSNYPPWEIEIDVFLWNELRLNFATGVHDHSETTQVGYIFQS